MMKVKVSMLIGLLVVSSSVYARGGGHSHSSGSSAKSSSVNHSPRYTGGPIVKTGPTKGQVRSRNQDGAWRKKRSDAQQ